MIIIYDLTSDTKINLIHHQHEVVALAFSPIGAANSQSGGDFLVSIDYDRNDQNDLNNASCSSMCLWNWSRGICIADVQIPRAPNSTFMLSSSQKSKHIQICFDKLGGLFFVLEASTIEN